jgi:1-phosphofructokinase family hexose kinase
VILSAGLSPAWQQFMVFDSFRYGEVNRAAEVCWCTAGKVTNAGNAAHHLGGPSLTLVSAGGSPLAEMRREFAELGVPCRWIETAAATRVCTTVLDRATGSMTELVENGRPITTEELDAFRAAYREEIARAEVAIIIGSLPAGTPAGFYREMVSQAKCPVVLDFRGEGLNCVLELEPYVVKPNREELGHTVGHALDDDRELAKAMISLNLRGARWVVVTQGEGPVWVSGESKLYRLYPPPVEFVNPIGCGDCAAAGIAWGIRRGHDIVEAVKLGIAAAGENLRQLLPCRLDPAKVAVRSRDVRVEEVQA